MRPSLSRSRLTASATNLFMVLDGSKPAVVTTAYSSFSKASFNKSSTFLDSVVAPPVKAPETLVKAAGFELATSLALI